MEHRTLAFYADVDDPQSTDLVVKAYCVLTELHLNYELQAVVSVFQCWRSQAAYEAGRRAFNILHANFAPDEGGKLFFGQQDELVATLGQRLRDYSAQHSDLIRSAIHGDTHPDGTPHELH